MVKVELKGQGAPIPSCNGLTVRQKWRWFTKIAKKISDSPIYSLWHILLVMEVQVEQGSILSFCIFSPFSPQNPNNSLNLILSEFTFGNFVGASSDANKKSKCALGCLAVCCGVFEAHNPKSPKTRLGGVACGQGLAPATFYNHWTTFAATFHNNHSTIIPPTTIPPILHLH